MLGLKSLLKSSHLWPLITSSRIYRKRKNPIWYKKRNEELKFYKQLLRLHPSRNELIFDVGANKGLKSDIFIKLSKRVIAFEPTLNLYEFLIRKFKNSNVTVSNYALSKDSGSGELFIVSHNQAYNSLNYKHLDTTVAKRSLLQGGEIEKEKVKLQTLDFFIKKYGKPKYIKIDVEGYENEVIHGLTTSVPIISFEANLPEFQGESLDCLDYLDRLSGNAYSFNFAVDNQFCREQFLNFKEARDFIETSNLKYLEVFAILSSSKLTLR